MSTQAIIYVPGLTRFTLVAEFTQVKNSPEDAGDTRHVGLIPGLGRSPGEGHGNTVQYSCLENPHGQRSLAGYSSWGHKQLDTIKCAHTHPAKNEPECMHFFSDPALLHTALSLIGKHGDTLPLHLAQRNGKTWEDEDQLTDFSEPASCSIIVPTMSL